MVGFPAARMSDLHTCPMCMGATLPVNPPCAPTVYIGKLNAARFTDLCACIAPPPAPPLDMIAFGSPTVWICGMPAARQFDPTLKGGMIVKGETSVLIGIVATPDIGAPGSLNFWTELRPDGTTVTHVGPNITITGTADFQAAAVRDLQRLDGTPTGHGLLDSINSGSHPVTIVETNGGNECGGYDNPRGRFVNPDGTPGAGTGSTVSYNPNRSEIGDGTEGWTNRPPAVGLGHELIHADDASKGQMDTGETDGTRNREKQAVGLPPYENRPYTENKLRKDFLQPPRPYY